MALTKCKECKKEVSTQAKTCPHCGVKDPGVKLSDMLIGLVFLVVIGWGAVALLSNDEPEENATTEEPAAPTKTPEQIAAELAACKADIQCWGDKYNIEAGIRCDEHVERMASYNFEWTDGWMEPKFSHFRWLDSETGTVTYIGDKIKFQNGFGAWQNIVYECDFDPELRQVLAVRGEPGRI